eukprot:TRINITY_DN9734_c0_g4_i2.p1 TRINITY_DN9734_c0_g4~~TRINITY_DN9734_c0_g4_i2.p1  ORF type:complete len:254 (-),score=-41.64 TRINITY_DN9734_c0_g4_i2:730-1491(-)
MRLRSASYNSPPANSAHSSATLPPALPNAAPHPLIAVCCYCAVQFLAAGSSDEGRRFAGAQTWFRSQSSRSCRRACIRLPRARLRGCFCCRRSRALPRICGLWRILAEFGTRLLVSRKVPGQFLQRFSAETDIFNSMIFLYLSFLLRAVNPCHGRLPLRKYSSTYTIASMSSLLLCSMPKCVFSDAYRAVPVKDFPLLYGMCCPVLGSLNRLASPKSITYTTPECEPLPITKLSGFTSRCIKLRECTYSMREN